MTFENIDIEEISNLEGKNFLVSVKKFPELFDYINQLSYLYQTLLKSFQKPPSQIYIPILQLFFVCIRGFYISIQLIGQGHLTEGYSIISKSSEAVGYSAVMKENKKKIMVWITKSDKEFRDVFGKPFPKNNQLLHPRIYHIYNVTRKYGSHNNFESTIHFFKVLDDFRINFTYNDYYNDKNISLGLLFAINSYYDFLIVYKEIFKDVILKEYISNFKLFENKWKMFKVEFKH